MNTGFTQSLVIVVIIYTVVKLFIYANTFYLISQALNMSVCVCDQNEAREIT